MFSWLPQGLRLGVLVLPVGPAFINSKAWRTQFQLASKMQCEIVLRFYSGTSRVACGIVFDLFSPTGHGWQTL